MTPTRSFGSVLLFNALLFLVPLQALSEAAGASQPKYGPGTVRLYEQRAILQKNTSPDFWALMPHYVHQQTGSACSIASVTMVLNGLRAPQSLSASDELFTQDSVLSKTGNGKWTRAVGKMGGGVTLDELEGYVSEALAKTGLTRWKVRAFHAADSTEFKKTLHEKLVENEKSDRNFLILNFLQSALTGDPEGAVGHLAPIAAYDEKSRRVLILDPDRQYYEPYWVSEEMLFLGLNTLDKTSGKTRGILWISESPEKP